jgi:phospholipid/cholesterol/gamma-HCH transport system substrate-binding protein
MASVSTEAKVGIFVLVALLVLAYMSFRVGESTFGFKKGYQITATFDNVAGLEKDAAVQVAGVDVGRVESISLQDGKAFVTLRIRPDVQLAKDVSASIKTHGILGDKYIELSPGTKGIGYLQNGEEIQRAERTADVDRLLNNLALIADDVKGVTSSLNHALAGEEGEAQVRDIVRNIRELSVRLNQVVANNDERFSETMVNLREASKEMQKAFTQLSQITESINKGEGTVGKLVKDKETVEKLNQTLASLESITKKINEGQGTLGKLVNEGETADNINDTMTNLNKYITKYDQYRTIIGYRGEYLTSGNYKSYVDLTIKPTPDYFYLVGVNTNPYGKQTYTTTTTAGVTTTSTQYQYDTILFDAQIGKRWKDIQLRGGIFESTGGFGADWFLFDDRMKATFEAYDFATNRSAHLKAYAEFRLLKNLYVSAGWDDPLNSDRSSGLVGVSIRFDDEDIKYLLPRVSPF